MHRFSIRLFAIASLSLLPSSALAAAISVSPTIGTPSANFMLSGAGFAECGTGESCVGEVAVHVDGQLTYVQNTTLDFVIDLGAIHPCGGCLPFNPSLGPHTIKVDWFSDCPPCYVENCLTTTFTVVDPSSVGDPWALIEVAVNTVPGPALGDTVGALFRFLPQGEAFTPCDTVHLIQVVKEIGTYTVSPPRFLTATEQTRHLPPFLRQWGDSLDAWTTAAHYHIDLHRRKRDVPYQTVGEPYTFSKPGRAGAIPDTARVLDAPGRSDGTYPDSVVKIVLDLEMNAFCAAGPGQGQYLGRCIWHWERVKGAPTVFGKVTSWPPESSLGQPTKEFKDAVERWAARTGFPLPEIILPTKGGFACP